MAKVITFSRQFPAYHISKGNPTNFVEQILNSKNFDFKKHSFSYALKEFNKYMEDFTCLSLFYLGLSKDIVKMKYHTIREGNRFKVGDKFSPRVWSGKPYQSKQITFAPDIEVKQVYDIMYVDLDLRSNPIGSYIVINGKYYSFYKGKDAMFLEILAKNEGLSVEQFKSWFNKPFKGQIICWVDETLVKY